MNSQSSASNSLALYAKVVVACTCILIFLGGLVTSNQAGMAVPDWPLSFGTLNPEGWLSNLPVRLEHGHRLFAEFLGLLITVLCAAVWRDFWPLLWATIISAAASGIAVALGAPRVVLAHLGIWGFAAAFIIVLLVRARSRAHLLEGSGRTARGLAVAAFIGVSLQATLGGLRVTQETAGLFDLAMVLRILHGCVAQAELCVLVSLATVLARLWQELPGKSILVTPGLRALAWIATAAIYVQLIVGATMRHLGAGLAIPTFPAAAPGGSWLPAAHNKYIDTNFTHTRVGAVLITILVVALAVRVLRLPGAGSRVRRPAWLALALLAFQITLGVSLIWHSKPPTPTTVHVVNGAFLLATSLLLSLRLQRVSAVGDGIPQRGAIPSREEERLSRAIAS